VYTVHAEERTRGQRSRIGDGRRCSRELSPYTTIPRVCLYTKRTRSSAIAERPAPRSASVETLVYCCTNNANRSRVNVMSIFGNCHVLFRYLHSFVHPSLHYRTASMQCRAYHQETFLQLACWCQLDCNVINQLRVKSMLLMTPRIPLPAHRRGRGLP